MSPITEDTLDILVVLDRSGSMATGRSDHEGGLKSFVADQRSLDGDVRFTFVQFDGHNSCEIIYDRVPLDDVDDQKIVLVPRGSTPLFSAVGRALAHLQDRQRTEPSGQTVCMIITDGENTDYPDEWDKDKVQSLVKALEKDRGWSVLYLGANVDAFEESAKLGVAPSMAANYMSSTASTNALYGTISNKMAGTRTLRHAMRASGMSARAATSGSGTAMSFTVHDLNTIVSGGPVTFDGGVQTVKDSQFQNGPAIGGGGGVTVLPNVTSGSATPAAMTAVTTPVATDDEE